MRDLRDGTIREEKEEGENKVKEKTEKKTDRDGEIETS